MLIEQRALTKQKKNPFWIEREDWVGEIIIIIIVVVVAVVVAVVVIPRGLSRLHRCGGGGGEGGLPPLRRR